MECLTVRVKMEHETIVCYCRDTNYIAHSGEEDLEDQHDRDKQEEQLANSRVGQGVVAFPDLLAPASSRIENILYAESPPGGTDRSRLRFHSPSYQPSSYRVSKHLV